MYFVASLLPCLTIILNYIQLSSQSQPPGEPYIRARSKSPNLRQTFPGVLGFRFEDLASIRLSPYSSPNRVFELRRYVFPPDRQLGLRMKKSVLHPMLPGEQIVLTTSDGDVCAMLYKKANRHTVLRGIFKPVHNRLKRVKINMISGLIEELTAEETVECPVSTQDLVAKSYALFRVNTGIPRTVSDSQSGTSPTVDTDAGVHHYRPLPAAPSSFSAMPSSPAESTSHDSIEFSAFKQSFPNVLGYRFEDLESIRLSPHNYPHRIFELRIYIFPVDELIGLKTRHRVLDPLPTGDQIVLSTSEGDVYAILLKSSTNHAILRPIFTSALGILERVKININSGMVGGLTAEENAECPVISKHAIKTCYKVFLV